MHTYMHTNIYIYIYIICIQINKYHDEQLGCASWKSGSSNSSPYG